LKALSEFNIQFESLKQGTHFFEFDVDNAFFELFNYEEFTSSQFHIDLKFTIQSSMMLFDFDINGKIKVPCDRCLEDVTLPIISKNNLIVKFGEVENNDSEEIVILPHNEYQINIAPFIYEYILVNIPQKKIHIKGQCNKQMIEKLEKIEQKKEINEDPRWSILNKLKTEK